MVVTFEKVFQLQKIEILDFSSEESQFWRDLTKNGGQKGQNLSTPPPYMSFFFQANSDDMWFIMLFFTWKWHTPKYKAWITMIGGLRAVDIVVLEVSNFNEAIFNRRWMITLDFWKRENKSIKREKSLVHFSKLAIGMFVHGKIRQIDVMCLLEVELIREIECYG